MIKLCNVKTSNLISREVNTQQQFVRMFIGLIFSGNVLSCNNSAVRK